MVQKQIASQLRIDPRLEVWVSISREGLFTRSAIRAGEDLIQSLSKSLL